MIEVGIVGGTGYTAGELMRLILHHPKVRIKEVVSSSHPGELVHLFHQDLLGEIDHVKFSRHLSDGIDVVFLCLGHGNARSCLTNINLNDQTKVIDLSQDFRSMKHAYFRNRSFIYGLPELQKELIKESMNIANPGCFATSILLALLPLAKHKLLKYDIHISAITGSTGSGKNPIDTTHFSWRNNNISAYKVFMHQHLKEVRQVLYQEQKNLCSDIYFVPYRGNFSRGILTTLYTPSFISLEETQEMYKEYYKDHPFVYLSEINIDMKQVINTNKCILYLMKEKQRIIIVSIIDNLIKGASGQAIQNMNLMFNIEETCGLILKSIRF
ncbi:N-acetyl-gamma-glutamyl-phosphate reductase [Blattabacterium cuenoti]